MSQRHPGRPKKTDRGNCKVEGCTKEERVHGLCQTHYMAARRGRIDMNTGAELRPMQRVPSYGEGARCTVHGCGNRPIGRGLCSAHYQKDSDRNYSRSELSYVGAPCLVDGCSNRPVNRWMCSKHAQQRQAGIIDEHGNQLRELMPTGRKRERDRWASSTRDSYIVRVAPLGHPHPRADGTILEHRLMMEDHLGRYLEEWEIVHHRDGNRSNNVLSNLELYDGRAKREEGPGHHPGHAFDQKTAVQVILQSSPDLPEAVASFLEGILNKGTN
jgi:hypothetical protein